MYIHPVGKPGLRIVQLLSGDLWAGAEVMAVNLIKELAGRENLHIVAVLLNEARAAEALRSGGCKVIVLEESKLSFSQIVHGFSRVLRKVRPDVVHTHRYKENLVGYIATRRFLAKIPIVATMHGMPEGLGRERRIRSRVLQGLNLFLLSHCFDHCVAVSEEIRRTLSPVHGFSPQRVRAIHNGIQLPDNTHETKTRNFTIGSCGRLFPVKNYKLFVEIAARVLSRYANTRFVLAGDGPERKMLQRLCDYLKLNGFFEMPGHVADISPFYEKLDLYLNTSFHEGIPMSVLEAMGHGVPVVAPHVGGFAEIIDDGSDGFLIDGHNPDLFARRCLDLISNPDRLEHMGRSAREKIEAKFSVHRMANDYQQLYTEIQSRRDRKSK